MARSKDLKVIVSGDTKQLDRALKKADNSLDKFGKQTRLTGRITSKGFAAVGAAATGSAAALGGLVIVGKKVVDAAIESEKSQARLQTQLKASGISYAAHAKEIEKAIQSTSRLAALDDEDLQDAFTNIVRVTGDVDKSLRLTGLAADFARAKHMDVAKAGEIVGKVAGGNIGILSRYGITIDKGASATEALGALQQKFAGQAKAYGETTGGAMDRSKVAVENLQESIGTALAPTVEKASNAFAKFVGEMDSGTGAGGRFVTQLEEVWSEAKPIVMWFGRAARNVAEFADEHPRLAKLAAQVVAVGLAVKALKFVSAKTGFTDLVKAGRSSMSLLRRVLARGGAEAGTAVAANAAEGMADQFPTSMNARSGRMRSVMRGVGKTAGRGMVVGIIAGLAFAAPDIVKWLEKTPLFAPMRWGKSIGKRIGKVLGTGDGIGKGIMGSIPLSSGSGGDLKGASQALGPLAGAGSRFGLGVTSGRRSGSITSSGNVSYHSSGEAIDVAGPPSGMLAYFRYLKNTMGSRLAELIYTPGGVGVKNGQPHRYSGAVAADHFDHVHVALDLGRPGVGIGDGPGRRKPRTGDGIGSLVGLAQRAGFSGGQARTMAAIAMAESGGRTNATNRNTDGSTDRGLWQINSIHGFRGNLFDPVTNARAARSVFRKQGYGAWTVYKSGAYKRFLSAAAKAKVGKAGTRGIRSGPSTTFMAPGTGSYEQKIAEQEIESARAEGTAGAADDIAAQERRQDLVKTRLGKVNAALKGHLRPATRLRLTQEKGQLLGELNSIGGTLSELRAPPEATEDPNQPLIDAINAAAEQAREQAEAQVRAAEEMASALRDAQSEIKRQNDFASSVMGISSREALRSFADVISGQLVGFGVTPRAAMPGSGAGARY